MSDLPPKGTPSLVIIISDSLIVASRILRLSVSFYSFSKMRPQIPDFIICWGVYEAFRPRWAGQMFHAGGLFDCLESQIIVNGELHVWSTLP